MGVRTLLRAAQRDTWARLPLLAGPLACVLLGGCAGAPSTIEPRGAQAARVAEIWWIMLAAATVVFLIVVGTLLYALFRRRERRETGARGPGRRFVLAGGVGLPVVVLVPLSVYGLFMMRALAAPAAQDFTVEVVGRQFWWEVRYPDHGFVTANEIRIPVDRSVRLRILSADVIHSFWVPQLMGKVDMIPGRTNESWVQAERAGVYWGECAEYCGIQHAKMALMVVAEPPEQFFTWVAQQQQPAAEPADQGVRRGAQVFAREGCIACHAIRQGGSTVGGSVGPDLTHVGSRLTLGAGILENNRGNLSGWIANAQAFKPGNRMPTSSMDAESLAAVVAYLESLK